MLELRDLLSYAFGAPVPDTFLERFVDRREGWDDEFRRRLDELAYEFRPDLAVWELRVGEEGQLRERRVAPRVLPRS